jgi:hypothetical protein
MKELISEWKLETSIGETKKVFSSEIVDDILQSAKVDLNEVIDGPITNAPSNQMPRRIAVEIALNTAVDLFNIYKNMQQHPSASHMAEQWLSIKSACNRLTGLIGWKATEGWAKVPQALNADMSRYLQSPDIPDLHNFVSGTMRNVETLGQIASAFSAAHNASTNAAEDINADQVLYLSLDYCWDQYISKRVGKILFVYSCLDHMHILGLRAPPGETNTIGDLLSRYRLERRKKASATFPGQSFSGE